MKGVNKTYHGNQFMIYVSHTIMVYILNLSTDVCQLFLNKTWKKNPWTSFDGNLGWRWVFL